MELGLVNTALEITVLFGDVQYMDMVLPTTESP